jgi:hypothetical protein
MHTYKHAKYAICVQVAIVGRCGCGKITLMSFLHDMYVCLCPYVYIHIHTSIHTYVARLLWCPFCIICMCVCVCVHMFIYIYIYIHTYKHTYKICDMCAGGHCREAWVWQIEHGGSFAAYVWSYTGLYSSRWAGMLVVHVGTHASMYVWTHTCMYVPTPGFVLRDGRVSMYAWYMYMCIYTDQLCVCSALDICVCMIHVYMYVYW